MHLLVLYIYKHTAESNKLTKKWNSIKGYKNLNIADAAHKDCILCYLKQTKILNKN